MADARGFKYADARIAAQLLCGLCKEPLCVPAELSCRHYFCQTCLNVHFNKAEEKADEEGAQGESPMVCPTCNRASTSNEARVLEHDHVIVGLLADLRVFCPRREHGCQDILARSGVDDHIAHACKFSPCSGEPDGCNFLGTAAEVVTHEQDECKFALLPCAYAHEGCPVVIRRGEKADHEAACEAHKAFLAEQERQRLEPQRLQRKAAREGRVQALYRDGQQRVVLNVGGRRFTLAMATIEEEHKDSLLYDLVQVAVDDEANADNEVFLDRDPDTFAIVVAWLRSRELSEGLSAREERSLLYEAQFLQLGALERMIPAAEEKREEDPEPTYATRKEFLRELVLLRVPIMTYKGYESEKPRINLDGICLRGLDLSGVDLSFCSLKNANLQDTNLSNANLYYADLTNANLRDANLRDANLRKAINARTWAARNYRQQ